MRIDPRRSHRTPRASQRGALFAFASLIAGVLAAACGDQGSGDVPDPNAPQYGVRDSAGIRIAENPQPAPDSRLGWAVSAEPQFSIGTTEGDSTFQLFSVADATRLADGRTVVANAGSHELLVFDAEGNHLDSWGGEGEGPGEFARLNRVRPWAGDSLIAADPGRGRVSIFDLQGSHGRTVALLGQSEGEVAMPTTTDQAPAPIGVAIGPDVLIGVLPNGTLFTRDDDIATTGFSRQDYAYALKSIDGEVSVSLGTYPGPQVYTERYNAGGGFLFIPMTHPFGQTTHTAVWGDFAVLARTETYEIRGYLSDGSLARIVRRDFEPGTPTQAEQDAHFRELLARYSEERRAQRTEVAANVPLVDAFPAFGAVVGDALGHLWVAEFKRPGDDYVGTLWTVFDGDGRALGLVATPAIVTVFEIGEDYILGEATDELGVEYVR
ncbi:MAG: 6-bladed beta-propeller, partial [Gemmatimonadetes bacterium]|nr:6-bladed beta-propeller [Gemmatimonadota bacterium]